jgi:hypothetical protein
MILPAVLIHWEEEVSFKASTSANHERRRERGQTLRLRAGVE